MKLRYLRQAVSALVAALLLGAGPAIAQNVDCPEVVATSTGGSPLQVTQDGALVSNHSDWHTAGAKATKELRAAPDSDVRVVQDLEIRYECHGDTDPPPDPDPPVDPPPDPDPPVDPPPDPDPDPIAGGFDDAKWIQVRDGFLAKLANNVPSYPNYDSTYYDGAQVMFNLADLTGDPQYLVDADHALSVYHGYALNGTKPGYWKFTTGTLTSIERNRGATIGNLRYLRDNMAYNRASEWRWSVSAGEQAQYNYPAPVSGFRQKVSRETAYQIIALLDSEKAGDSRKIDSSYTGTDRALVLELVDFSEHHLYEWINQSANPAHEGRVAPFMVGLTARALIQFYEWENQNGRVPYWPTRNWPDIPTALEAMANALLTMQTTGDGTPIYREEGADIAGMQYEDKTNKPIAYDLNMLIAPLYEFLFNHDPVQNANFRGVADKMFNGAYQNTFLGNGKQYNQSGLWLKDHIDWREGR